MTATADLEKDHIHVLMLCDVMEEITKGEKADPAHLESVVSLIRNFADGLHHKKEEDLFFPKLAEKGFSPTQGPVAVMLHEHVQGRNYVKAISDNIPLYKSGDQNAKKAIYASMLGYASLLRDHIAKENNILFRMADNALSGDEQQALLEEFSKIEKIHAPGGNSSTYKSQIEDLARIYRVKIK